MERDQKLKSFRKYIEELTAQQKIEFARQNAEQDRKFAEVLESIRDLKSEIQKLKESP